MELSCTARYCDGTVSTALILSSFENDFLVRPIAQQEKLLIKCNAISQVRLITILSNQQELSVIEINKINHGDAYTTCKMVTPLRTKARKPAPTGAAATGSDGWGFTAPVSPNRPSGPPRLTPHSESTCVFERK